MAHGTAERILSAATDLFSKCGFAATTTKEIACRAKVNEVTLFRLFQDKRAILRAVMAQQVRLVGDNADLAECLALPDFSQAVQAWSERHIERVPVTLMRLAIRFRLDASKAEIDAFYKQAPQDYFVALVKRVETEKRAGRLAAGVDPNTACRALMALITHFLMRKAVTPSDASLYDPQRGDVEKFVTIWLRGIRK